MNDQKNRRKREEVRKVKKEKGITEWQKAEWKMEWEVGKSRRRDGEEWCGNSHLLSCSPQPCATVCWPPSSSVHEAFQGQEGCRLSWKGAAKLPWFHLLILELFPSHCTHWLFTDNNSTLYYFTGSQCVSLDLWKHDDKYLPF